MAHQVQEQLSNAVTALKDRNPSLAQLVLSTDEKEGSTSSKNRDRCRGIETLAGAYQRSPPTCG